MIPIKITGDLTDYNTFIKSFKKKLSSIIKKGYIGKRKQTKVSEIIKIHNSLSDSIKIKFIGATDYEDIDDIKRLNSEDEIFAPKQMLSDKETLLLTKFRDDIENIANATPDQLKCVIAKYQKELKYNPKGKLDKTDKTYLILCKIFIEGGFEQKGFKEIVWKLSNLRVCPYCNRTYIPLISWESKKSSIKGQLDHFYPKEIYPYLAISLYNLVPSCSYCNGVSCKGTNDPFVKNIVSPFNIKDHNGLRFKIESFDKGINDLKKCEESIKLGIDTSLNNDMKNNDTVFHLLDIYSFHRDIAAEVIFKYRATLKDPYLNHVRNLIQSTESTHAMKIMIKDFLKLYWGASLEDDNLGERPMSKFTLDLIYNLNEVYDRI